jgi:hypothetical protein
MNNLKQWALYMRKETRQSKFLFQKELENDQQLVAFEQNTVKKCQITKCKKYRNTQKI